MRLYLIRHAQSENNARPESERHHDPGLTDLGRRQADCLAEKLPELNLTRLITSPFLRTLETTDRIRKHVELSPEVRIHLHEQGGCYQGYPPHFLQGQPGMTREEIEKRFPDFGFEVAWDDDGWWRSQSYETWQEARHRARSIHDRTCAEFGHTSERVAYVMHADIKVLMLEVFHDRTLNMPANASVTNVEVTSDGMRLLEFNSVDHLPSEFLTF